MKDRRIQIAGCCIQNQNASAGQFKSCGIVPKFAPFKQKCPFSLLPTDLGNGGELKRSINCGGVFGGGRGK
jgi:hypothetical protein